MFMENTKLVGSAGENPIGDEDNRITYRISAAPMTIGKYKTKPSSHPMAPRSVRPDGTSAITDRISNVHHVVQGNDPVQEKPNARATDSRNNGAYLVLPYVDAGRTQPYSSDGRNYRASSLRFSMNINPEAVTDRVMLSY